MKSRSPADGSVRYDCCSKKSEEGVHGNAKTMLPQFSVCVLLDLLILLSQSLEPQR